MQNGGKLVHVLGRDVIGRPSRVSYVQSTNIIIVTDDQARQLKVFSAADWTQRGSIFPPPTASTSADTSGDLLPFPSGHCVTPDGRLAVIDFESKSVVVWNAKRRHGADSDAVMVCQTALPCPGNVAVTRRAQLAVTDSKARTIFIFLCSGLISQ